MASVTFLVGGLGGDLLGRGWLGGAVRPVPTGVLYTSLLLLHVLCAVVGFGTMALTDGAWIESTRHALAAAAARLDAILRAAQLDILGGTSLFRLIRTDRAGALFHHLGRAGILTRAFAGHPTWLRFGLPAAEPNWQRLQIAMAEFADSR